MEWNVKPMTVAKDMKAHADAGSKKEKNCGMKETKKFSFIKGIRLKTEMYLSLKELWQRNSVNRGWIT